METEANCGARGEKAISGEEAVSSLALALSHNLSHCLSMPSKPPLTTSGEKASGAFKGIAIMVESKVNFLLFPDF